MTNRCFLVRVICVVSLLLGCSPSKSEQTAWEIKQGALLFGSEMIDWQQSGKIGICDRCIIKRHADFHPSGPTSTLQLFDNAQWRASKVDEFQNWIVIWQNNRPVKLFVKTLSEQALSLSLPSGDIKFSLGSRIDFNIEDKHYQLWIKSYRQPTTSKQYANELDSHHINYLLLSVD